MTDVPLLALDETLERMSGDRELLYNLFQLYLADAPKKLTSIAEFMDQDAMYQIERTAHSMKGASATVGAARMALAAADMEKGAREKNRDNMTKLFNTLQQVCAQTLAEMQVFAK